MENIIFANTSKVLQTLDHFAEYLKNQGYKDSVKNIIVADFQENFIVGGRPQKWEPLSDITLEMRRKRKNNPTQSVQILRDTGRMFASIHAVDRGKGFYITTNTNYDSDMHFGIKRKKSKVPARPFFVLSPEALQEINNLGSKLEKEILK